MPPADRSSSPPRLVLAGLSARMMAQSARRGGWRPLVLDLFGDRDTRAAACCWIGVGRAAGGFDATTLIDAVRAIGRRGPARLVAGSGFDGRPELLESVSRHIRLAGNGPDTVRLLKEPRRFFALLERMRIPFPETRFGPHMNRSAGGGWLIKQGFSEGGAGVRPYHPDEAVGEGTFVQRRIDGPVLSVLFLANGSESRIVGFNRQWASDHDPRRPFLFAGIVGPVGLDESRRRSVTAYVSALAAAAGLKGLNSLDFVCDGDDCLVLEVNPRPGASLVLYDQSFEHGLLAEHLRACRGLLPQRLPQRSGIGGYGIVFAPAGLSVPSGVEWPRWAHDRPFDGTFVSAGQPLCSVTAGAATEGRVVRRLQRRRRAVLERLLGVGHLA